MSTIPTDRSDLSLISGVTFITISTYSVHDLYALSFVPLVTTVYEMCCSNQIVYSRSAYSIKDMYHMVHGGMYRISVHHNYGQPPKKRPNKLTIKQKQWNATKILLRKRQALWCFTVISANRFVDAYTVLVY